MFLVEDQKAEQRIQVETMYEAMCLAKTNSYDGGLCYIYAGEDNFLSTWHNGQCIWSNPNFQQEVFVVTKHIVENISEIISCYGVFASLEGFQYALQDVLPDVSVNIQQLDENRWLTQRFVHQKTTVFFRILKTNIVF